MTARLILIFILFGGILKLAGGDLGESRAEGPMVVNKVTTFQPVMPAMIRKKDNPILGLEIRVEGQREPKKVTAVKVDLAGTTDPKGVRAVRVLSSGGSKNDGKGSVLGEGRREGGEFLIEGEVALQAGENYLWVSVELADSASLDGVVDGRVLEVKFDDGVVMKPEVISPRGGQRIGYAVRLPGDDGSKSYRIPGLARSLQGTLVAVYDIRYRHSGDLPADIDVGVSRSTDGGQSWEPMIVAMDLGDDPKHKYDGVGDPAILVDPESGRIWIAALWSHGNHGWHGSGPGMTPEETGQFMLAHSDDDGKTWSRPINITPQTKNPEWRLFFNGPGAGMVMVDGTLVFPAQYRAADGIPWSTVIWSQDRGATWKVGAGVKSNTTEAQVIELADGSIMINCRDNRGGARTVATSQDLGKTWTMHPTDRKALREPVCMASLLRWNHSTYGDWVFFSNPNTTQGRKDMTLKISRDEGMTWPESKTLLYDSRSCFGYSCLAEAGPEHLGVLYEGTDSLLYLRFPLAEILR